MICSGDGFLSGYSPESVFLLVSLSLPGFLTYLSSVRLFLKKAQNFNDVFAVLLLGFVLLLFFAFLRMILNVCPQSSSFTLFFFFFTLP